MVQPLKVSTPFLKAKPDAPWETADWRTRNYRARFPSDSEKAQRAITQPQKRDPCSFISKHMKDACSLKTELISWDSSKEVFLKWWKSIWVETIFMQDTFTNIKGPWLLGLLEAILKYINITMNFSHQFHQLKLYLFDLGSSLTFLICKMETTEHSWIFCED